MNHRNAVESEAVERYQLGELSPAERDEFEQHYFGCPECAAAVHEAAVFAANARAVFIEEAGRRPAPALRRGLNWWRPAFVFAAAGALLFVLAYEELLRIPGLKRELARLSAPQSYPAFFLRPVARGDDQSLAAQRTAAFLGLSLDVPPGATYTAFECEIRPESGGPAVTIGAAAQESPGAALSFLVPTHLLKSGRYTLTLRGRDAGGPGADLGRYNFNLQLQ